MVGVWIPTVGLSPHLVRLIKDCLADPLNPRVYVLDNGMPESLRDQLASEFAEATVKIIDQRGKSLYQMWNQALTTGRRYGDYTAIFNDDIQITPNTITVMKAALEADPSMVIVGLDPDATEPNAPECHYVTGTYKDGGLTGFAFMVYATDCPLADEKYNWWYGDDDLVKAVVESKRHAGKLIGWPVWHAGSLSGNAHWERLQALVDDDRRHFEEKWANG